MIFFFISLVLNIASSVSYSFNFRPINLPKNEGCTLSIVDGISRLEVRSSLSLPITIIDSEKVNQLTITIFFCFVFILLFRIQLMLSI